MAKNSSDSSHKLKQLQHTNSILNALSNINRLIVTEENPKSLVQKACKLLVATQGFRTAWIVLIDEQGKYLYATQAGVGKSFSALKARLKASDRVHCIDEAAKEDRIILIDDPAHLCSDCPLNIKYDDRSGLVLRLIHDNKVYGTLTVSVDKAFKFNSDQQDLLREVAADLAFALRKMELEEDQLKAKLEFEKREKLFRSISEHSHSGIIVVDDHFKITYVNDQASRLCGYSKHELLNLDFRKLFDAATRKTITGRYLERMNTPLKSTVFEFPLRTKHNELRWVESRSSIFTDEHGRINTISQLLDISERRKARQALKEKEAHFRTIVNQASVGIIVIDLKTTRILETNKTYQRIVGYSARELTQLCLYDIVAHSKTSINKYIKNIANDGYTYIGRRQHRRKDNSLAEVDISSSLIELDGRKAMLTFVQDVSLRIQTEQTLKENLRQQNILMHYLPGMAYRRQNDPSWTMLFASEGCMALTGFQPAELIKNSRISFTDLILADDRKAAWKTVRHALKNKQSFQLEYRIHDASKNEIWVWDRGQGVFDKKGKLQAIEGFITNIDNRKKVEEALVHQVKLNQQTLQTTLDGYILADQKGIIIDVNPSYCRKIGYSHDELVGMDIRELEVKIPPAEMQHRIEQMIQKGHVRFETQHRRKDRKVIDLDVSIAIMSSEGEQQPLVAAFVRDITEQKRAWKRLHESEANLRSLLNARNESIWSIDKNSRFLLFNDKFAADYKQIYGIELEKGISALEGLPPEILNFWQKKYKQAQSGQRVSFIFKESLPDAEHIFEVLLNPIQSDEEIVGVSAISSDITERRKIENKLHDSEERFRLAFFTSPDSININRLKDGVYVEINQGFSAITGYSHEEVIGKSSLELNIWANTADRQKLVNGLKKHGHVENMEAHFRMKDGKVITGLMSASVIMLNGVMHIISITRNIDQLKQLQSERERLLEETETSRQLLSDVFSRINDGVIALDKNWNYTYVNAQAAKMLNRKKPTDLLRKNIWKEYPEGVDQPFYKAYRQAMKTQQVVYLQDFYEPWHRWFENRIYPSKNGLTIYFTEITERKQAERALQESENRYRTIFESANVGIGLSNLEGRVISTNPLLAELMQYDESEWQALDLADVYYHKNERGKILKLLQQEGSIKNHETQLRRRDGQAIWVSMNISPVELNKQPLLMVSVLDITKRKQSEQALQNSEENYRMLLDFATDAFFQGDANGNFIMINKRALELTGYSKDKILKMNMQDLFAPDLLAEYPLRYDRLQKGETVTSERTIICKDSSKIPVEMHSKMMPDGTYQSFFRDISERKHAEEALRESGERFRTVVEQAGDAVYVADFETAKILFCNKQASAMLGYTKQELLELKVSDLDDVFIKDDHRKNMWKKFVPGETVSIEVLHKRKDGSTFPVEVRSGLIEFDGKKAVLGFAHDISDRKRAEDEIKRSQDRLEVLHELDHAILEAHSVDDISYAVLDRLHQIIPARRTSIAVFDEQAGQALVYSRGLLDKEIGQAQMVPLKSAFYDLKGLHGGKIIHLTNFEEMHDLNGVLAKLVKAGLKSAVNIPISTQGVLLGSLNFGYDQPSGFAEYDKQVGREVADSIAIALQQARLYDSLEKHAHALEISLKELQQIHQLSLNLGNSQVTNQVAKHSFEIIRAAVKPDTALFYLKQDQKLELLDYFSSSEDFDVSAASHHQVGECLCGIAAQKAEAVYSIDILKDNRCSLNECKAAGLHSFSGLPLLAGEEVIGVIGLGSTTERDFAAQKSFLETLANEAAVSLQNALLLERLRQHEQELEQKINQRTADLVAANKDLEAFAYSISHDLRAPLRHIAGFTAILQREIGNKGTNPKYYFDKISDASSRMKQMIDDLLSFSRIGRGPLTKEEVDLNAIISAILDEQKSALEGQKIIWEISDLPKVPGDGNLIRIALENLLSNAIKFSSNEKTARIKIGFKKKNNQIEFAVKDNGVGFDAEYSDKLFNVFQRLHTDEEFPGTGIGLANVKRIIEKHGGQVRAESKKKGATFYFSLPILERNSF